MRTLRNSTKFWGARHGDDTLSTKVPVCNAGDFTKAGTGIQLNASDFVGILFRKTAVGAVDLEFELSIVIA
jgi:hypothetical protein